jgi:hypothetical protein
LKPKIDLPPLTRARKAEMMRRAQVLEASDLENFKICWDLWGHPMQRAPEGDWTTWLMLGGRGAGKTRAGAEWVRELVSGRRPVSPIALVGETMEAGSGFVRFSSFAGCAVSFPTIAGGVLVAESGYVVPAPQSGTTDDVDTIDGGFDGAVLIVTGSAGKVLTFRDGIGNLKLGGDRVLDAFEDALMLVRRGSDWIELSFSSNG